MTTSNEALPGYHRVLSAWNPLDPRELANPYSTFAVARREAPVFYSEFFSGYVVTRYDDIIELLKDTKRFSNRSAIGSIEVPEEVRHALPNGFPWSYPSLVNNDPPQHSRIRKLANEAFKPAVVVKRESVIREIGDRLIDDFIDDGHVDFISGFANMLPGLVICRILGVADEHTSEVVQWSDDVQVIKNPNLPAAERVRLARGQADFYEFCRSFIQERRERPRDDLASKLIHARVVDEPALTEQELISTLAQLLIAGNETTRKLLGNLLLRLLEHPDQLEAVRDDLTLGDAAVEETLRHSSSVKGLFRQTTEAVELGGVTIPAEQVVVVMWSSANHDETQFEQPEEFDIFKRDSTKHIAFSKFAHFCLGAWLAKLEARIALEQLLTRLPNLRRANNDPIEWMPHVLHMGVKRLDLAWDVPRVHDAVGERGRSVSKETVRHGLDDGKHRS